MVAVVQLAGSLVILTAFLAAQRGRLDPHDRRYLVLNALGSGVLAGCAVLERQWGFLLLEGVWALVSVAALVRPRLRSADAAGTVVHGGTVISGADALE